MILIQDANKWKTRMDQSTQQHILSHTSKLYSMYCELHEIDRDL
jgi:hypothetical protein